MKTSNYITISYLILLFGGVLALFLAAEFDPKADVEVRSMLGTKELGRFSVVLTEAQEQLILKQSQKQELLTFYNEGDQAVYAPHEIRNDTLFIFENPKSDYQFIQVHCSGIKSIVGKEKSFIRIDDYQGDTLEIKLEKAKLIGLSNNVENRISLLTLIADRSYVSMGANVDKLEIHANLSRIQAYNSFESVTGYLKNYSNLHTGLVNQNNVNIDSTSIFPLGN